MQLVAFTTWAAVSVGLAVQYALVVGNYRKSWLRLPAWDLPAESAFSTPISVIVPARNEAPNLVACLSAIANQSCPAQLYEVIVVDDGSTDGTFQLARDFAQKHPHFKVLQLDGESGSKKKAIERGIGEASGELIVCTDADCLVPVQWLQRLAAFYEEKKAKFIAAPVNFQGAENSFQRFQSLDLLGMMGVTGAGFQSGSGLLCNGANLAYPKSVFQAVGGFSGIDNLASGDDMLLLHKVAKLHPDGVFFLKNKAATVMAKAQPSLSAFISQRLRWASKSRAYDDFGVIYRLSVAFVFCWLILINTVLSIWWAWPTALLAAVLLTVKSWADYRFLSTMADYFDQKDLLKSYWRSQLMHTAYIIGIGTLANLVKRYEWKGRKVA